MLSYVAARERAAAEAQEELQAVENDIASIFEALDIEYNHLRSPLMRPPRPLPRQRFPSHVSER